MTPQLERQLIEMGVIPATMLESLQVMSRPNYPDLLNKNYYFDPRDEFGEPNH